MSNIKNLEVNYDMLSDEKKHDLYLRKLATGEIQGPPTGKPSQDKPWLKYYSESEIASIPPEMSMYEFLYERNKEHLDDIAIVFDTGFSETRITYRKLFENIDKVAKSLLYNGVKKGNKVAISMSNSPESAYLMYAINKIGGIICPIDPRTPFKSLESDLSALGVDLYVGIPETKKKFLKANDNIKISSYYFVSPLNSSRKKLVKCIYNLQNVFNGNYTYNLNKHWSKFISDGYKLQDFEFCEYDKDMTSLISFTGGTTGVHKGVELTDYAMNTLVFSHDSIMKPIKRGDIFMNILPQFMVYGIFTLHLSLCKGLQTYMLLDSSPENFVTNLKKINPTMAFGGPIHWETLIDNENLVLNCLNNLRAPISGGEALSLTKERQINDSLSFAGAPESICNGFGASELCGSVTLKYGLRNKAGSVGRLHVFDNAKIIDSDSGTELGYNEEGDLYVTSPSIMKKYYNNEEETSNALFYDNNGVKWFKTGDLATIDENGDITITGRKKRLFVCGVNNIYPPQLEEIICSIKNVKKCVVVDIPDDKLRAVPKVHIVLEKDSDAERKRVVKEIEYKISSIVGVEALPHYYSFDDDLLYTLNGKIDFNAIRNNDIMEMIPKQKVKVNK